VQSGRHAELIASEGPYRRLMGAQAATLGGDAACVRAEFSGGARPATAPREPLPAKADGAMRAVRDIDADAAAVGWRDTLRSLAAFIRPWRWQLALTTACGIGRVVTFVGVGVLGALVIATVKANESPSALVAALLVVAPLAGLLHWLESWLAHDMAYRLLAEMRIRLFAVLDAWRPRTCSSAAPGIWSRSPRRTWRPWSTSTPHRGAGGRGRARSVRRARVAGDDGVAACAGIVAVPGLCRVRARPAACARDRLGSAARSALGQVGAHVTETIQGLAELSAFGATARRRAEFVALVGR